MPSKPPSPPPAPPPPNQGWSRAKLRQNAPFSHPWIGEEGGGGRGRGVNFLSILSEIAVPYPLSKKRFTAFFTKSSSGISEYVCRLSVVFSVSYSIPVTFKYYRFKLNLPDLGWWNIPQNIQRTREAYTSVTTEKTTTLIAGFSLIFHVA